MQSHGSLKVLIRSVLPGRYPQQHAGEPQDRRATGQESHRTGEEGSPASRSSSSCGVDLRLLERLPEGLRLLENHWLKRLADTGPSPSTSSIICPDHNTG